MHRLPSSQMLSLSYCFVLDNVDSNCECMSFNELSCSQFFVTAAWLHFCDLEKVLEIVKVIKPGSFGFYSIRPWIVFSELCPFAQESNIQ